MIKYLVNLMVLSFFALPVISQNYENDNNDNNELLIRQEPYRITNGPYLQHLGETGVTIVWITNREGVGWVELAPDDETHFYYKERPKYYSSSHGLKNVSTIHTVRLENLNPGTRYRYRVYSQEVLNYYGTRVEYGNTVATNVYRSRPLEFVTNDHSKGNVSFVMLTDIHGNSDVMQNLLKHVDWDQTDLVFFNGDMYSHLESQEQLFEDFMDTAVEVFASQTPMYYARGNHEARGNYAHNFFNYFPSPAGKLYYMVRQGPVSFIVFDSGEDKPDSDIEYYNIVTFDQYMDEQAAWLKGIIKDDDFLESSFKIAVVHIPPYHPWHGARRIYEKFVPLLNEAGIDLMLCGHRHRVFIQEPVDGIDFPVIENANNTILSAESDRNQLIISIKNLKGEVVESFKIIQNH